MRAHGQTKLGFFPLPPAEAKRLKNWLNFTEQFSALDPCVGDGVAFAHLLRDAPARRFGIEIDAYRAEQARALHIETLQANAMDVRCQADAVSLAYLNPPYDWEAGASNNQRLEYVFLEHTYRWLKPARSTVSRISPAAVVESPITAMLGQQLMVQGEARLILWQISIGVLFDFDNFLVSAPIDENVWSVAVFGSVMVVVENKGLLLPCARMPGGEQNLECLEFILRFACRERLPSTSATLPCIPDFDRLNGSRTRFK